MPDLTRTIHLLTRKLPEGLWLVEPLHHPEIARLGSLRRVVHRDVIRDLQRLAERLAPGAMSVAHGGPPAEIRAVVVPLEWGGEKERVTRPLELLLPSVLVRLGENELHAYLPAVDVQAFGTTLKKLDALLELEVRRTLKRHRVDRDLVTLARLTRADEMDVEPRRVRLRVPTAVEYRRRLEAEKASLLGDQPVLPQVATLLRPRRCREAFEIDAVVEQIARELTGADPASVLLVGPAGAGKTAAIHELVRRGAAFGIEKREVWETRGSRLAAGAVGFGMLQERFHALVRELRPRDAILLLGSLFEIVQVGRAREGAEGAGDVLQPLIAQGRILAVAECTPEQADALERSDPRLVRAFRRIEVREPDDDAARRIVGRFAARAESRRAAVFDEPALDAVLRLHRRYAGYSALPGKALLFLDGLLAESGPQALVGEQEVVAAFSEQTGLPRFLLDDTVRLVPDEVRGRLRARIFGQNAAVDTLVDLVVAIKAGLGRAERPLASLLFAGPTGVGKTETAKAIAEFFFGSRDRLTRFDMSEYADAAAVVRLIGGTATGEGLLTAKVREQPFQVLLLDEIEKADPRLFDLLLQVLGEGRLTDAGGRTADFRNAVVILTSNLGAESFRAGTVGFGADGAAARGAREHFEDAVRQFFRPELFNRLDRVVPFLPLQGDVLRALAERELGLVRARSGVLDRRLGFEVDEAAVDRLALLGADAAYGARPLKRAIDRALLVPLAHRLAALAWDQPAAARAEVDPHSPGLTLSLRGTGPVAETAGAAPALAPLSDVRRRLQRFRDRPLYVRLEDEILRLAQARDALHKPRRGRAVAEALRARVRQLKRMEEAQQRFESLEREVLDVEEAGLLACFGLEPPDRAEAAAALGPPARARMRLALLHVLALEYAEPDRAHVIIVADAEHGLPALLQGYLDVAARWSPAKPLARLYFSTVGKGPKAIRWRAEEADAARLRKGHVPADAYGAALTIEAPLAFLLLEQESGAHTFIRKGKSQTHVIAVLQGTGPAPDAPNLRSSGPPRREYNFDSRMAKDHLLDCGLLFRRTELGDLIGEGIDRAVDRRIDELTEP